MTERFKEGDRKQKGGKMRRVVDLGISVLALLCLVGCVEMNTVIKVRKDGSGTVEETVVMTKEAIEQMGAMTSQFGMKEKDGSLEKGFEFFNMDELKKRAANMGKGVTLDEAEKVAIGDKEGYQVVYKFSDINNLKVNQNPGDRVPSGGAGPAGTQSKGKENIKFQFTKGRTAVLTVKMPAHEFGKKPKKEKSVQDQELQQAMAMMSQFMKGMKVSVAIEVEGSIVDTNAALREGSKVTLMEMDFDKLLANQEAFKKFISANPQSLEEAKKMMKDVPGIMVEPNQEVTIKFR